jgi:predicted XRE-type DNA-binding protein
MAKKKRREIHVEKFPPTAVVKRMRDKLSDPSYDGGNLALPANATEAERVKYRLCQLIARYQREHGLLQKEIADLLGIDESRISDILRGKLEGFTLDRLIGYAQVLHPGLKVTIDIEAA